MTVRAAVPESAIYEEFYENAPPGSWAWIREVYVGDGAFIIVDDGEGDLWRIPYTESNGDIAFGTPERVVIEYVPAPADDETDDQSIVLAARNWGVEGPKIVAASAANNPAPPVKGASAVDLTKLRTRLGLPEDASEEDIEAKLTELEEAATKPPVVEPPKPEPAALPDGVVAIEKEVLEEMRTEIAASRAVTSRYQTEERKQLVKAALADGKIHPTRVTYWEGELERDFDGTSKVLASLEKGSAVPISELGNAGSPDSESDDAVFAQLFPGLALVKEA